MLKEYCARRTDKYAEECAKILNYTKLKTFGGHHGISVLSKLNTFDFFSSIDHDLFHDLILGILENELIGLVQTEAKLISTEIKLTVEVLAHYSSLSLFSNWKGIDKINCLLYSLIPMLIACKDKEGNNFSIDHIKRWSTLGNFYLKKNKKKYKFLIRLAFFYEKLTITCESDSPTISDIVKIHEEILQLLREISQKQENMKITLKLHSLSHQFAQVTLKKKIFFNFPF